MKKTNKKNAKKERLASKVQHLKRKCDMIMEESETVKKHASSYRK